MNCRPNESFSESGWLTVESRMLPRGGNSGGINWKFQVLLTNNFVVIRPRFNIR